MGRLRSYYYLTKPGIIRGNLLMGVSGYLLAASYFDDFDLTIFIGLLAGMALVIASACVFNNYLDRGIDAKMERTSRRALVTKQISGPAALIYAVILGVAGFAILALFTNWLVVWLNLTAAFLYIVVYGWAKRNTHYSTLIGAIPGAIPPAAGFAAVKGRLDAGGLILFLIMFFWQMAHFYAVGIYRFKDYRAAGLPILPVKQGVAAAKRQITVFIWLFAAAAALLTLLGYTGIIYLTVVFGLSGYWLWLGSSKLSKAKDEIWGKKMFRASLIVIAVMSIVIPLGSVLP